jgi:hypothetical protein
MTLRGTTSWIVVYNHYITKSRTRTSPCPTAAVTTGTRHHGVLAPTSPIRSASPSRPHILPCAPAQPTHKSRSASPLSATSGTPTKMWASLMLLRPTRTWVELRVHLGGIRGGDAASIVPIRVTAAVAASRPTSHNPGGASYII